MFILYKISKMDNYLIHRRNAFRIFFFMICVLHAQARKKNARSKDTIRRFRIFHGKLPLRLHAAPRKNVVKFRHAKAT